MDAVYVDVLEEVGKFLLSKSQSPPVREKKKTALAAMRQQLLIRCGLEFSGDQILKKINNMKTAFKEKTDTKKTGNVKIVLNQPQEKFYGLLGGVDNPSIISVPYGLAVGSKNIAMGKEEHDSSDDYDYNSLQNEFLAPSQACQTLKTNQKSTRGRTQQTVCEEQLKFLKKQQDYTDVL
ncbi:uncharacterized protein LOC129772418 [Toxorhynchites rutilus septentrionalis]|uniref:uncharacterized protein LOC129772418 n=1 Tax=Toxorhynchites rutilus septentrionalis TaxID=329112 RepID=UPI00247A7CE6|nr:uncharacterized protein LOC129772418 [Toxorhynchites rutilus septentrionalis]XP_055632182.1 uncharacterized protein LOC129772418 [Toxorhynchites rutilus septentrionalis]